MLNINLNWTAFLVGVFSVSQTSVWFKENKFKVYI